MVFVSCRSAIRETAMSDDLVKRLREEWMGMQPPSMCLEAANRIEKLEAALREVIGCWDWWQVDTYDRCSSVPADAIRDARKALEGKDG
jgi:hypothetical protein